MKKIRLSALFAAFAMVLPAAELSTQKVLNLAVAKQIAAVADAEAVKNNWTMVIAIVDAGGNLLYLQRADNTQIASIEVAQQKAKSAVGFKRPTKAMEDAVAGGRTVMLKLPIALPVEGGVPFFVGDKCIGAIGISGATSQQDGVVAAAALAEFNKIAAASK